MPSEEGLSASGGIRFKLVVTALLWAGAIVAGRFAAGALTPIASGWVRYLAATLLLVPLLAHREGFARRLTRDQWIWTVALGLAGVVLFNLFFFAGLEHVPASRGTVIMALNPAMTVIALALFFGERPKPARIAGVVLAWLGAWIVLTEGRFWSVLDSLGRGDLLMFGASFSWTVYGLIARFGIKGLSPVAATTYASTAGWIILSIFAAPDLVRADWAAVSWPAIAAMVYMGLLGTALAFVWYTEGLIRLGPARATVFMNLIPVFSVTLAAVLLGETIGASMIAGGLVTLAGIVLVNRG